MRVQQQTRNGTLATRAAIWLLGPLRANLLLQSISVVLALLCNNAASQLQFVGAYGFRDDLDGVPKSGVIYSNGEVVSIFTDFDDFHQFSPAVDTVTTSESGGTAATDVLDIVWLGETPRADRLPPASYTLPLAADPIRMYGWFNQTFWRETPTAMKRWPNSKSASLPESFSIDDMAISNRVGFIYGFGAIGIGHELKITASGSILGHAEWTTSIDNQIIGPKLGLIWQHRIGAVSLDVQGFGSLGVNTVQVDQSMTLGEELIPGALNRALYGRPIHAVHYDQFMQLTPTAELRTHVRTRLTEQISLNCRWSSLAFQNIDTPVPYYSLSTNLSEYQVVSNGNFFIHQLYCGIEYAR